MAYTKEFLNALSIGTVVNGSAYSYTIRKVLGQGTFGITYLASVKMSGALGTLDTEVFVAIKEFFMKELNGREESTVTGSSKDGAFAYYKSKFIHEAENLSKLKHPNIIKVVESFEENNTAYYAMEYIEGGSLDDRIAKYNGLSELECINYACQIGKALEYMHSQQMLHLDLKPNNIMLHKNGQIVLIDFGLAKQFGKDGKPETSTTIGHGTPGYAPIEQANYQSGQGFPVTMDIYALGATLYKMLSGKRPPNASEILNEGIEILNLQFIQNVDMAGAISKAMSPLKNKRFQKVGDFINALNLSSTNSNKEYSCFPRNTISYLIVMKNQVVIYYYRGAIYKDLNGSFLNCTDRLASISDIRTLFNHCFIKYENLSFGEFIEQYGETMSNSDSVYTSFLNHNDYFRIISSSESYTRWLHVKRVMQENSYVAAYLSCQLHEKEMTENSSFDIASSITYDNSERGFIFGDGVCEIYNDFKTLKDNCKCEKEKRYLIKSSENLKIALLGGMLTQYRIFTGKERNILLLDIVPFDICFGPQWGKAIPKIIDAGATIPTRKSDSFDFVGTDIVSVKIENKIHLINLIDDFGYAPRDIECTVEVGSSLKDIKFDITDKTTGKSKSYPIERLTMLHHEEWK